MCKLSRPRPPISTSRSVNRRFTGWKVICQRLIPSLNGRVRPACEILRTNALVKKLIIEESVEKLATAIETSKEEGMMSFNQALYQMVKDGVVDQETAMRFASNPEALHMNLRGIFLDAGHRIVGR